MRRGGVGWSLFIWMFGSLFLFLFFFLSLLFFFFFVLFLCLICFDFLSFSFFSSAYIVVSFRHVSFGCMLGSLPPLPPLASSSPFLPFILFLLSLPCSFVCLYFVLSLSFFFNVDPLSLCCFSFRCSAPFSFLLFLLLALSYPHFSSFFFLFFSLLVILSVSFFLLQHVSSPSFRFSSLLLLLFLPLPS